MKLCTQSLTSIDQETELESVEVLVQQEQNQLNPYIETLDSL